MMTKQVLFRGDDAGGCHSANGAIREAADFGLLRNVSLMVCGPAFEEAVTLFNDRSDLCLGLHFVLNAEWETVKWGPVLPASEVPSLIDPETGFFTATPSALQTREFSADEALAELAAQLERAREAGLPIVYLDQHMGVGRMLGLSDALADFCRREKLINADAIPFDALPPSSETDLAEQWAQSLEAAAPGTYRIVTHPGKDAPDMQAFYLAGGEPGVVARERDAERQALTDSRLHERFQQQGIRSVRYDEVGKP